MYLVRCLYHQYPLRGFYVTFDEPLLQRVYRQFLPLAYGKLFVLLQVDILERIIRHEHESRL